MNNKSSSVLLGFSEVDITPQYPVELVGFDRVDNTSKGIRDPLVAQITIWQKAGQKVCLLSIDSLGFTVGLTNSLRDAIAQKLDVTREKVMVCFAHTHAAPNASEEERYFDYVLAKVLTGVEEALSTLQPVEASWGNAQADIGVNRRMADGPVDRRIGILKITDAGSGEMRLLMLRVTAHANVLTSDNYLISSDYFGATRKSLREIYGCPVLLTQGASGNIRPKYQQSDAEYLEIHAREASMTEVSPEVQSRRKAESQQALDKMAATIRTSVEAVIADLIPQPIYSLDMTSEVRRFLSDVPREGRAQEIADEALREAGIDGAGWLREVSRLRANGIDQQYTDIEIQYFFLNNGCWCGVPNEIMCEIALEASRKADDPLLYLAGYTNACDGYLPTAAEFRKGGYEVLWSYLLYYIYHGRVMPLEENTADELAEIVARRWIEYKFTLKESNYL